MQKRRLACTDIYTSVIGLGTVKLGRETGVKYPTAFQLPTDSEIKNLFAVAKELGINLLDTAPAYGTSEERIGKCLINRHEWVIVSKAGEFFHDGVSSYDFSPAAISKSVESSLQKLKTDYLDVLLIHSNGDDEKIIQEDHAFETLDKLKKAGKIRSFGMSTKTVSGGLLTLQHADVAMVTYRPDYLDELAVIQFAEKNNKSVFVKKAFASGHQVESPELSLSFILKEPAVASVIIGTINPEHLKENAGVFTL